MSNETTIHKSSNITWNQMIADLSNCANTVHEQNFVQDVKESGKLTLDNVVDFFDSNNSGEIDVYDSKAWFHRSFLTQYVDIAFEDNLKAGYIHTMKEGMAVDKLKVLDMIRALPASEEIALLKKVVVWASAFHADDVVLKKALFRLQELEAKDVLANTMWVEVSQEFDKEHTRYKGLIANGISLEFQREQDLSLLAQAKEKIQEPSVELDQKKMQLEYLRSLFLPEVEGFLIEVVQGDYEFDLQVMAIQMLGLRNSQTSYDFLKSQVLREDDYWYQLAKGLGCDLDRGAREKVKDKQHPDYRHAVNKAFSNHRLFDATKEVRALLAAGYKNFSCMDMRGADLSGLDFSDCDMMYANLAGADLTHTNLGGAINANLIFGSRVKLGDGVWLGDLNDLKHAITEEVSVSGCVGSSIRIDEENLGLFQKHTHYFSDDQLLEMLHSTCGKAVDLALLLAGVNILTPEFIPVYLERVSYKKSITFTEFAIEKLRIIQEKTGESVWNDLIIYLTQDSSQVRKHAIIIAGELCGEDAVELLIENIKTDRNYSDICSNSAEALAKIKQRCDCVDDEEMIKILDNDEMFWASKYAAALYLGLVKSKQATVKLWLMMLDRYERHEETAIKNALVSIQNEHGSVTDDMIIKALQSNKYYVVNDVLDFLEKTFVSDEVAQALISFIAHHDPNMNVPVYNAKEVLKKYCENGGEISVGQFDSFKDTYKLYYEELVGVCEDSLKSKD